MILSIIGIAVSIRSRQHRIQPVVSSTRQEKHQAKKFNFVQKQMIMLMAASVAIFTFTALPISIYQIIVPTLTTSSSIGLVILLTAVFDLFTKLNYSTSFYLHTLTSKLFREEFFRVIHCFTRRVQMQTTGGGGHTVTGLMSKTGKTVTRANAFELQTSHAIVN
ncbi:unnamed protein product [Didymodactylos carnosus]|uniref:G protein-coupled receptor n=1 Tax=Didymodactylos carnosus TaxID=1234261 RepID=A0A815N428_9BILA|nr:unnamed protein product [Didymodactylos carnosus]CAF1432156.1 unnamed protein product [Didymodactylos carnosus]CAF4193001.1 unnamed protein product [Didymodactylos carnosus]CAF4310545.1 unnamed protein product [Didymodactylos carnosus]